MYIGEVAKRTGASPKAIRLYETLGLLPPIERKGKYRFFTDEDVEIIQIIKRAQRLGFKLAEIKTLLDEDVSCDAFPWEKTIVLVKQKIEQNKAEISKMEAKNTELFRFVAVLEEKACN